MDIEPRKGDQMEIAVGTETLPVTIVFYKFIQ